jgi:hypothetical protein
LIQLFLLRAAAAVTQVPVRWIPFKEFISLEGARVSFDRVSYLQRALMACGHASKLSALDAIYRQLETKIPTDSRYSMNGHDALELLALCVKGLRPAKNKPQEEELFLGLYMAADWPKIVSEPSVKQLLLRAKS